MNYGQKFALLRVKQNISLDKASHNITSKSSLSRWENGEGPMDIDKVVQLLNRIGLNTIEFFAFQYNELTQKASEAYDSNDIKKLKNLAILALNNFHNKNHTFNDLFNAAIACSDYFDLSNKNLFSNADTNKLISSLSNTKHWSQEKIELFGGSILLLPTRKIFSIGGLIIADIERIILISDFQFSNTYEMLLNAILALIEKNELMLSSKLFDKLDSVPIKEHYMITRLRKKFIHGLILYCQTRQLNEIEDVFKVLSIMNMELNLTDYRFALNKIRKIYRINR